MVYAPILIPTLCRYNHFIRCVESLKKNSWAKYTDIYIALDYPLKKEHEFGYRKITEYLKGDFSCFNKFEIIYREKNYGAGPNVKDASTYLYHYYDRIILSEDDNEFSENFLEYMDKCLDEFENDDSVIAVAGYSYDVNWKTEERCNIIKQNHSFNPWGTGQWRDKSEKIRSELNHGYLLNEFGNAVCDGRINKLGDARFYDYAMYYFSNANNILFEGMSDVALGIYMTLNGKYEIMPVISKVRNHGFDGTGLYCQKIERKNVRNDKSAFYDYSNQSIDTDRDFFPKLDTINQDYNWDVLNKFMYANKIKLLILKCLVGFCKVVGAQNCNKVRHITGNIKKFIKGNMK